MSLLAPLAKWFQPKSTITTTWLPPEPQSPMTLVAAGQPQMHAQRRLTLEQLGQVKHDYAPTYDGISETINEFHRAFLTMARKPNPDGQPGLALQAPVEGWLQPADAMKIYEMAYFAEGDIAEWGTYLGLSASIMLRAGEDSTRRNRVWTVDIDPEGQAQAKQNLSAIKGHERMHYLCMDGYQALKHCVGEQRRFDFIFIDHSHAYEHMIDLCRELYMIVNPGGFCLFHDYNDARNREHGVMQSNNFGVYQAVEEGLSPDHFTFYGIYGACALYRRNA